MFFFQQLIPCCISNNPPGNNESVGGAERRQALGSRLCILSATGHQNLFPEAAVQPRVRVSVVGLHPLPGEVFTGY